MIADDISAADAAAKELLTKIEAEAAAKKEEEDAAAAAEPADDEEVSFFFEFIKSFIILLPLLLDSGSLKFHSRPIEIYLVHF